MLGRSALLFGLVAGVGFLAISAGLGALLPDYNPVAQTISEIGERGSPFETTYRYLFYAVALCLALFSYGVGRFSRQQRLSLVPALMLGFYAAMELAIAIFESPHPLHNVFGISSMVGFLAPMALAFTWPTTPAYRDLRKVSATCAALLIAAIAFNLLPLFIQPDWLREHYGLGQRALFAVFYGWLGYLSIVLFRSARQPTQSSALAPALGQS